MYYTAPTYGAVVEALQVSVHGRENSKFEHCCLCMFVIIRFLFHIYMYMSCVKRWTFDCIAVMYDIANVVR